MSGETLTALTLTGPQQADFILAPASALPAVIPPGGTFVVDVTFALSTTGLRSGLLSASFSGQGGALTTALSGTGN